MKKFRSFVTVFFLLTSLVVIVGIALYDNMLVAMLLDELKNYLIPVGIAVLIFLILLSAGIATNSGRSFGSLSGNGFFQLAVLELFTVAAGLVYYRYDLRQPGQIIIRLEPEKTKDSINVGMKYQSSQSSPVDTVIVPATLHRMRPGNYSFETLDRDIVSFDTVISLEPGAIETLAIPVVLDFKTVIVNTEPQGADIWIDSVLTAKTPDTLNIFNKDSIILELKMEGYETYVDTLALKTNRDLGVITLNKLYTFWIYCNFSDMDYSIYDMNNEMIFTAVGTKKIRLPKGRYRIEYGIGEGQTESRMFDLNYNYSIKIPY
jgi:hypothetical protein